MIIETKYDYSEDIFFIDDCPGHIGQGKITGVEIQRLIPQLQDIITYWIKRTGDTKNGSLTMAYEEHCFKTKEETAEQASKMFIEAEPEPA